MGNRTGSVDKWWTRSDASSSSSSPSSPSSSGDSSGIKIRGDEFDRLKQLSPTYSVDRVIGTGGFGSVSLGHNTVTGQPVALKFLPKTETSKRELRGEVELQKAVHTHRGVNTVLDVCQTPREWVVVMEYLSGGELFDKLIASGAYSEREASEALRIVCSTISHLHSSGIVHGDIKPENIMLKNQEQDADLELIDFGMAFKLEGSSDEASHGGRGSDDGHRGQWVDGSGGRSDNSRSSGNSGISTHLKHSRSRPEGVSSLKSEIGDEEDGSRGHSTSSLPPVARSSRVPIDLLIRKRDKKRQRRMTNAHRLGTTAYAPPEVLQSNPVGEGVDMWALGVITYILLSGTHPFDLANDASDEAIEHNIISNSLCFDDPVWESVSPSAIELIRLLLAPDPHDRPSAEEALEHPWLAADAYERLGSEPLTEVAENLTRYQRGRRYLRASVLAVLLGIADVKPNDPAATAEVPGAGAETATELGSSTTTSPTPVSPGTGAVIVADNDASSTINDTSISSEGQHLNQQSPSHPPKNPMTTKHGRGPLKFNRLVPPPIGRRGSTTLDASRKARQRDYHIHRGGAYAAVPLDPNAARIASARSVLSRDQSPETFSVYQRLRRFDRDNKGFITHHDLRMVTSELGHELTEEEIVDMADSTSTAKMRGKVDGAEASSLNGSAAIGGSRGGSALTFHQRRASELVKSRTVGSTSSATVMDEPATSAARPTSSYDSKLTANDASPSIESPVSSSQYQDVRPGLLSKMDDDGPRGNKNDNVSRGRGDAPLEDAFQSESPANNRTAKTADMQRPAPSISDSAAVGHQDIQRILTSLRTQRFGHGDIISREGQVERIWHLLLDGQIEMSQRDAHGKNVVMNHVFPGEHFGAWELMGPDGQAKPRRKTGRCVAELCEVLTLPQSDLEVLTNTFEKVRERMARQSRMRTREMLRSYLRAELTDYKEEIYEAGEIVYAQGEVCDSFFIVLDGEVDVTRESDEQRGERHSIVVEQLGEGDFFPLGVLGIGGLRQNTRGATVSARVPTRVARVSGEALRNFAETRVSHAQIAVVADLAEDLIVRHEMRARRGGFSSTLVHDEENGREGTSFPVRKQERE